MTNPPAQTPADYPGKTLGIVGLILAIVTPLIGLIVSLIAQSQSKKAGYPNSLAKWGVIIGAILTVLGIIVSIFYFIALGTALNAGVTTY